MGFLIGAAFVILAIGAGAFASYQCSEGNIGVGVVAWVLTIALVIGFICVPFSLHTVDESEVCVIKQFGKVKEVVEEPGMFFDFWMGKSYKKIDTKTKDLKLEAMTYSSDAQVMTIALTFQYHFLGGEAKNIVKEFGNAKAVTERITSVLTETPKAILANRTAMEIISNRGAITPEILEAAKVAIGDKYPVEITNVAISNIDFSDAFEQAVEEKMIAEQNKLKADYENEKKLATAKADAEAKVMAAEAEAKANELLEKSLTDKILQEMYIDKWNGQLPNTMLGEGTNTLIPIG